TRQDAHLLFDGIDLVELAGRLPTPLFLYSERRVAANAAALRDAFTARHADTEVFFASKACGNLWFLRQVQRAGIGVEVNSGGELWKALRVGFGPERIVFNGVAKTSGELAEAARHGIHAVLVDSLEELERLAQAAAVARHAANAVLRVDVQVPTHTHPEMQTAYGGKFGIDIDDAVAAFQRAQGLSGIEVRGLHLHIGSQITTLEPYAQAVETALDLVDEVERSCGLRLEYLDVGGGFAVPYRETSLKPEAKPDPTDYFYAPYGLDDYAEVVCGALERRRRDMKLLIEPGRSLAATTGVLVTRVQCVKTKHLRDADRQRIGDERWLLVDAGYNTMLDLLAVSWYFPVRVASRAGEAADTPFRLAGPLCDGGDVFAGDDGTPWRRFPGSTTVGDVLVLLNTGAYALELMTDFNGRPRAGAYAVSGGEVITIRRPETYEDLIRFDVE
ncbi:MAG TPA: diaminopimelate decarboxylase, partial [Thermoleophilia bacterium]|nr:diaminopimelate decarboxylase [Thermoleophilia bacterium]